MTDKQGKHYLTDNKRDGKQKNFSSSTKKKTRSPRNNKSYSSWETRHKTSVKQEHSSTKKEPQIPEGVQPQQLSAQVRQELATLSKTIADKVACHMVAAGLLLDEDPQRALQHAHAARGYSNRIPAIREVVGIAAYRCGDWGQALSELRTARRMGSTSVLLPILADCERGIGRPQRAIELATSPEAATLTGDDADELAIVLAGARAELGHLEQALTVLATVGNNPHRSSTTAARLCYARADILLALGRNDEALESFLQCARLDVEEVTDAEERITELGIGHTLIDQYDCLLVDLDGTVFRGSTPTPGALEALNQTTPTIFFVTNNASRSPEDVAIHLQKLGFHASANNIVTSGQAGITLLTEKLAPGSRVFVLGTSALTELVEQSGFVVVDSYDHNPLAVIQGYSPHTSWQHLAEAALTIRQTGLWIVTNMDPTLPSERGLLPGNGSIAAALKTATGVVPLTVGKPQPALFHNALARGDFYAPLVIGDRLDTDIAGAIAADLPSLMVLTGVSDIEDLFHAPPTQRPTYLGRDLQALHQESSQLRIGPQPKWKIHVENDTITISTKDCPGFHDDGLSLIRALAHTLWNKPITQPRYIGSDDTAIQTLTNHGFISATAG